MFNVLLMAILVQEPAPTASPSAPPPVPASSPAAASPVLAKKGTDQDAAKTTAPTKGQREVIKGTFQGFDAERGTVSFVDPDGRTQVWPVDTALAAASSVRAQELADRLKIGMHVVIRYVRDTGQPVVVYIGQEGRRREADKR